MWQPVVRRASAGRNPDLGFRSASTTTGMTCRAVVVPRFGGPEVLEVRDGVAVPDLKPTDVLVRARAVSVNPLDLRVRSGYGRSIFEAALPLIIGRDVSGEVAAIGGLLFLHLLLDKRHLVHSNSCERMLSQQFQFDAALDTIGIPETERTGINLLKKGGNYMTLQGEAASLADRYGLVVGLPSATAILLKKQIQYRYSHGIAVLVLNCMQLPILVDEIASSLPFNILEKWITHFEKRLIPGKVVLEVD